MMVEPSVALAVLDRFLRTGDRSAGTLDDWEVVEHEDALVFGRARTRSNQVFLVDERSAVEFAPSRTSVQDAYLELLAVRAE